MRRPTLFLSDEGDADWKYAYAAQAGARLLKDGDVFTVGNIRVRRAAHAGSHARAPLVPGDGHPGQRPADGHFTGDFVFVGDVGRPDLLEKAAKMAGTMEAAARTLFRSLDRFRELPDYVQVWPGHGAGSACGKALGAVPHLDRGLREDRELGL